MNLLKLERVDQGSVWYLYQPEGKGEFGEVVFHFASAAPTVAKAAPQPVRHQGRCQGSGICGEEKSPHGIYPGLVLKAGFIF